MNEYVALNENNEGILKGRFNKTFLDTHNIYTKINGQYKLIDVDHIKLERSEGNTLLYYNPSEHTIVKVKHYLPYSTSAIANASPKNASAKNASGKKRRKPKSNKKRNTKKRK